MSVSSSSNSECDLCYNSYISYTPQPLYPELGQPLIYYAQVQRKQRTQKNRKKNNCFVKAFRWYTEEHVPLKKIESGSKNEDIQGFAAWLDQKYDEYIRRSQITQIASSQFFLKPTSSFRTRNLSHSVGNKISVPRQNKMKSPWRRRKKYFNKLNGDTIKKSDHSIEFILNPKNLSRSASEFCQKCRHSNNAIMIDRNTFKSKSESIIYILKEKEMFVVPSDSKDMTTVKKNCNEDKIKGSKEQIKINTPAKDISCQCSIVKIGKVDASNQFSNTKISHARICECVSSDIKVVNERVSNFHAVSCTESQLGVNQKVLIEERTAPLPMDYQITVSQKSIPNIHSAIVSRETSFSTNKNVGKNERPFSVNGIAQTSDHAINLSNIVNPESTHLMFFKIICVDK